MDAEKSRGGKHLVAVLPEVLAHGAQVVVSLLENRVSGGSFRETDFLNFSVRTVGLLAVLGLLSVPDHLFEEVVLHVAGILVVALVGDQSQDFDELFLQTLEFALHGRVPMVLDGVVGSADEYLGDVRPSVA